MERPLRRFVVAALLVAFGAWSPVGSAAEGATVSVAGGPGESWSIELSYPQGAAQRGWPVLVVIPGGLWDKPEDTFAQAAQAFDELTESGLAIAVLSSRGSSECMHPCQAADAAAAVAALRAGAPELGLDPTRIFLAGHSSGAQTAVLLALDERYLAVVGLAPSALAGVICYSGIYDLEHVGAGSEHLRHMIAQTFGTDAQGLSAASPITHARADSPPLLVLVGERDVSGFFMGAKRFGAALRRAGNTQVRFQVIPAADHFSLVDFDDESSLARRFTLDFVGIEPLGEKERTTSDLEQSLLDPPYSTAPFWSLGSLVREYPMEARLLRSLAAHLEANVYQVLALAADFYYAIPLADLLGTLEPAEIGSGDYLVTTNIRDERYVFPLAEMLEYDPVVVVGLGEEHNLFSLASFYRAKREYSWVDPPTPPPVMYRPVGAMVYFRQIPPDKFQPQFPVLFSLTIDGFRRVEQDPLAQIRDIPAELWPVFTNVNGCAACHLFKGVGARAHHVTAVDGKAYGGYALPLEDYPPDVWKRFVFHQEEAADLIGANPNRIDPTLVSKLYDLVEQARAEKP